MVVLSFEHEGVELYCKQPLKLWTIDALGVLIVRGNIQKI